jgi:hypothetical protein
MSGCLLQVPTESGAAWAALPEEYLVEMSGAIKDFLMFGPDWTRSQNIPEASHVANSWVPKAELIDITSTWTAGVRSTAAQVTVPVHSRQGEFDQLWITDAQQVADFGAAFTAASLVDAKLFLGAGHCIDFHRGGRAFQLEQLVAAGLTPVDALRSATVRPAQLFDLGDRGRIEPGLRADLLLVEGDPTAEIAATRNIRHVWIGGTRVL